MGAPQTPVPLNPSSTSDPHHLPEKSGPTISSGGKLSIVATPIGNLGDISARMRDVFANADVIACEDTRRSVILLEHCGLHVPLVSLHEHNEAMRSTQLIERIKNGEKVALVSDAGHPLLSDPGERFLQKAIGAGVAIEVIPGPCAVTTALSGAGLPATPFYFGGFLPPKSGRRQRQWEESLARTYTSVFFESPHRLAKSLREIAALAPERLVVVARELTKKFEEFRRAPPRNWPPITRRIPRKGKSRY
jgi:16S rRNA (cytidine1402-2'-O)-methyltransferase